MPYKDLEKKKEYMKKYNKAYNLKEGQAERNREKQARHYSKPISKKKRAAYQRNHDVQEKKRAWEKNYRNKTKYGLLKEDYDRMFCEQGGKCAICGRDNWGGRYNTPYVDHDHKTGFVRGLLCYYCNISSGLINDDPKLAIKMSRYLERGS